MPGDKVRFAAESILRGTTPSSLPKTYGQGSPQRVSFISIFRLRGGSAVHLFYIAIHFEAGSSRDRYFVLLRDRGELVVRGRQSSR